MVANIMRLVADAMAPGALAAQPQIRARLLDWLRDTTLYLRSLAPFGEAFWEVSQVGCCCLLVGSARMYYWMLPTAVYNAVHAHLGAIQRSDLSGLIDEVHCAMLCR
jgi:hypothetical protein